MIYVATLEKILTQTVKVNIEAHSQAHAELLVDQLLENNKVDFNTGESDYVEQVTDVTERKS